MKNLTILQNLLPSVSSRSATSAYTVILAGRITRLNPGPKSDLRLRGEELPPPESVKVLLSGT